MAARQRLWAPLSSAALRRASSAPVNISAAKAIPLSRRSGESGLVFFLDLPGGGLDFLGGFGLSGKRFCCQTARGGGERCWSCGDAAPFLVCRSCRCVQPVDRSVDYFQIFGLEKNYDIEEGNLEGKYKGWQKKIHPDLVHSKSEKEREYAAEQSARVIDAYRTLSKPLSRAIYVLKLEGVDVDEEETISEPELLSEIMEIREAVEEAADSLALNKIQSEMKEKLTLWSNLFSNAFRNRNFGEAVKAIRRMTYYERVIEETVKRHMLAHNLFCRQSAFSSITKF